MGSTVKNIYYGLIGQVIAWFLVSTVQGFISSIRSGAKVVRTVPDLQFSHVVDRGNMCVNVARGSSTGCSWASSPKDMMESATTQPKDFGRSSERQCNVSVSLEF